MNALLRPVLRCALPLACGLAASTAPAQSSPAPAAVQPPRAERPQRDDAPHRWSVYWGWNRGFYPRSDIHFSGPDHDFTLEGVKAHDSQSELTFKSIFDTYLNPGRVTIPQTNARVAYRHADDAAIAFNLDHMKYVMTANQRVPIQGSINGVARSGAQTLSPDFLTYEHTDGLNLITLEYEKHRRTTLLGAANPARFFGLVGAGIAMPKSNVTLGFAGQKRNDEYHVAGYTLHAGIGVEADFWGDYFVRTAYKLGWVNLPDVLTSARGDKASQKIVYNEVILAVGFRF